jgi:hypothetical protein
VPFRGARRLAQHQSLRVLGEVAIALDPPGGGDPWTWNDPASPDRVCGPALDFCLVVTQRRHRAHASLVVEGPLATEWMAIAQAFAGPPGWAPTASAIRGTGRSTVNDRAVTVPG